MQVVSTIRPTRLARLTPGRPCVAIPLLGIAARSGPARQLALAVRAAKGFGKPKPGSRKASDDGADEGSKDAAKRGKRVRLQQSGLGLIPGQPNPGLPNSRQPGSSGSSPQSQSAGQLTQLLDPNQAPALDADDDTDFLARLASLKEQKKEREAAASAGSSDDLPAMALAPAIFDAPVIPPPPSSSSAAPASSSSLSGSSSTGSNGSSSADGSSGSIYDNPPPLSQTVSSLLSGGGAGGGADTTSISDPKLRDANIGPSQLGLAAGAVVFVAVFVLVAAGDYAPASKRYSGVAPAQAPPDAIEEKILESKVSRYQDLLKANPADDTATEALAQSYVRLLKYDKAADMYEKLAKRNPDNPDAWRLLGESSLLAQQARRAVPAFQAALSLRHQQPDLQLLTGLVDAYVAAGEYPRAVEELRGVRTGLETYRREQQQQQQQAAEAQKQKQAQEQKQQQEKESAAAAPEAVVVGAGAIPDSARSSSAKEQAKATAAAGPAAASSSSAPALSAVQSPSQQPQQPQQQPPAMLTAPPLTGETPSPPSTTAADATSSPSISPATPSTSPATPSTPPAAPTPPAPAPTWTLDPVGVDLLVGKVYSAWRGHEGDALATYDALIKERPEDFRGYLAKGLVLKEQGRKADAERMFLQARFFAPSSLQQVVRSLADTAPVRDLPENN